MRKYTHITPKFGKRGIITDKQTPEFYVTNAAENKILHWPQTTQTLCTLRHHDPLSHWWNVTFANPSLALVSEFVIGQNPQILALSLANFKACDWFRYWTQNPQQMHVLEFVQCHRFKTLYILFYKYLNKFLLHTFTL